MGFSDLASVAKSLYGAGNAGAQEDWLNLSANAASAVGKSMWYSRNQIPAIKQAIKDVKPSATWIIDVAMVVIQCMDFFNGFLTPDEGGAFDSGSQDFALVYQSLQLAIPDERDWSGGAEEAYAAANAELMVLAATVRDLDKEMQDEIAGHAATVQEAHTIIATTMAGLVLAQGTAAALYAIPGNGPLLSEAFQVGVASTAIGTVLGFETVAVMHSEEVAHHVKSKAREYRAVAAAAQAVAQQSRITDASESTAGQSTNSVSFEGISDSMSGEPATFGRPTVAALAEWACQSGSHEERDFLDALFGDGDGAGSPVLTPGAATMEQVSAAPRNVVNQTTASPQQPASVGRQGRGASTEKDVAEEAVPEGAAAAGAGAGFDTAGAQRAPVNMGPEAAPQPGHGERRL